MTTIENLERQKLNLQEIQHSKYDMGETVNWEQIFGRNKYLWFFPIVGESGKPIGDGVIWPQRQVALETVGGNDDDGNGNMNNTQGTQLSKRNQSQGMPNQKSNLSNQTPLDTLQNTQQFNNSNQQQQNNNNNRQQVNQQQQQNNISSNNNSQLQSQSQQQQNFSVKNSNHPNLNTDTVRSEEMLKFNYSPQNNVNNINNNLGGNNNNGQQFKDSFGNFGSGAATRQSFQDSSMYQYQQQQQETQQLMKKNYVNQQQQQTNNQMYNAPKQISDQKMPRK